MKKRLLIAIFALVLIVGLITSCDGTLCIHTPDHDATCTEDSICIKCGKILEEKLGHAPNHAATCTEDSVCTVCEEVLEAAHHTPDHNATCTDDSVCTVCEALLEEKLGHSPNHIATCIEDSVCTRCDIVLEEKLGHSPNHDATCTEDSVCTRCDIVLEEKLGHSPNHDATCTEDSVCTRCEFVIEEALGHNYVDCVCTECGDITLEHDILIIEQQNSDYVVTGVKSKDFTELVVPSFITIINKSVFNNCNKLENLSIPFVGATIDSIKNYYFGYIFGSSYSSDQSNYIPLSLKSVAITGGTIIFDGAFSYCNGLASITIGNSITYIGASFYNCSGLTNVFIGSGVTSISNSAFYGCSELENITVSEGNIVYHSEDNCLIETASKTLIQGCKNSIIPTDGSVTCIGNRAFADCKGLTSITIPDSVTNIGWSAFYGCSRLTSAIIGNGVTSIGDWAFDNCGGLTSVTIGNGVMSIGANAFSNCIALTSITIPDSVTSIGDGAFSYCSGLTSITIPDSVTSIGVDAFYNTTWYNNQPYNELIYIGKCVYEFKYLGAFEDVTISIDIKDGTLGIADQAFYDIEELVNVTMPDSVTNIGNCSFHNCTGLTDIIIGNGVTCIDDYAFSGCSGLTSITIPESVTSIGISAFWDCSGLESITVSKDNSVYHSEDNCLIETASSTLIAGCNKSIIPTNGSVTSIGAHAFSNCSGLTSITIPDSVTSIGNSAFYKCSGLTAVYITNIAKWCNIDFVNDNSNPLYYAHNLYLNNELVTDLVIPENVTSIGKYAFYNCSSLTSITIPDSVTTIGENSFYNTAWYNNQLDGVVYAGKVAYTYKGTIPENTSITLNEGTIAIATYAFSGCSGLSSITIPDSVISISNNAFSTCDGLTSITIPNSVINIGESAFSYCTNLTDINIPESLILLDSTAFRECAVKNVTIDSGVIAKLNFSYNTLLDSAETVYVKEGLEVGSYITTCFTLSSDSDKDGYLMYTRN